MGYLVQKYTTAFEGNEQVTSLPFTPHRGATKVTVFVKPTADGDAFIERQDSNGEWAAISETHSIVADTEQPIVLDHPVSTIRLNFENTDDTEGTVLSDFVEGGQR